jgi:hypothetical protein
MTQYEYVSRLSKQELRGFMCNEKYHVEVVVKFRISCTQVLLVVCSCVRSVCPCAMICQFGFSKVAARSILKFSFTRTKVPAASSNLATFPLMFAVINKLYRRRNGGLNTCLTHIAAYPLETGHFTVARCFLLLLVISLR